MDVDVETSELEVEVEVDVDVDVDVEVAKRHLKDPSLVIAYKLPSLEPT